MNKKWIMTVLLTVLFLLGGFYMVRAQMMGGKGGQGQPGGAGGMGMGMMGGGGSAMVVYDKHIYVLSGNVISKIDPVELQVKKELTLKQRMPKRPAPDEE